ncbi:COG4223 family protein [Roseobacter litoralis]|uniref:Mitochondrial inner membrane protein n=2 Tax=Roseobacter litoralis TaxID=42443 RepID=F7ZGB2_ROSLO|nr:hypothetical protein [Roseobacter litoralis]AEI96028.1 hypothetical protein RLO149_c041320 [Roseobacter litoralis Och 149]
MEDLAKSRKPNKATETVEQGVEKPIEAEEIVTTATDIPDADGVLKQEPEAQELPEKEPVLDETPSDVDAKDDLIEDEKPAEIAAATTESETVDPVETVDALKEHDAEDKTDEKSDAVENEAWLDTDKSNEKELEADTAEKSESPWDKETDADPVEEKPEELEPESVQKPVVQPQPEVVRGSMWPAIFGGVVAALIGFIAGRGDTLDAYLPASMQRTVVDITALEAASAEASERAAAQAALIEAQAVRLDALEAVDTTETLDVIAELEADIAALTATVAALENQEPVTIQTDNAEANEAIASLQTALEAQNEEIAALAERAEAAEAGAAKEAAQILARAALTRVVTAVDSGQPFGTALADLEAVTPVEVPSPLQEAAENGVPTMAVLREDFPDVARSALTAARSETPESEVVGITGFFQRQLNMRSVTPREGSDPDAVLSRMQAAVENGDLETALTEADGLPEAAKVVMADWVDAAQSRKAAQDAANELADSLNSN